MKLLKLPSKETVADAIILANGSFPTHDIPLSILRNAKQLVCCDGAIDKLSETGIIPQAIIGDCDSMSAENRIKYQSIIHHIKEQETNDLTKSLHFCLDKSLFNIVILGATGCREDHTIGNISLLAEYIDYTQQISIVTDYGIFDAIQETTCFASYPGQNISIFSISQAPITTEGLKYTIKERVFNRWWQATLNEALTDSFKIATTGKTIVFRSF